MFSYPSIKPDGWTWSITRISDGKVFKLNLKNICEYCIQASLDRMCVFIELDYHNYLFTSNISLSWTSLYWEHLFTANISLSWTSLYHEQPFIATLSLSRTSLFLGISSISNQIFCPSNCLELSPYQTFYMFENLYCLLKFERYMYFIYICIL